MSRATRHAAHSRERLELLQLMFGAVAHELGNLSSPIGLIADSMAAGLTDERRMALAGTLRLVATGMRDLTAATRQLRGHQADELLDSAAPRDLARWWPTMSGLVSDILPGSGGVSATVASVAVPSRALRHLTIAIPALIRGAGLQHHAARTLSLALQPDSTGDALTCTLQLTAGSVGTRLTRDARRWTALACVEFETAGGTLVHEANAGAHRWMGTMPLPGA